MISPGLAEQLCQNVVEDTPAPELSPWLLWQLVDSAFPTGGYAHSNGLEAAWQHGEVQNIPELESLIQASLEQVGHASLPFVRASYDGPERFGELDQLCEAFTTNHVANRASRLQGRALLTAVRRIFFAPATKDDAAQDPQIEPNNSATVFLPTAPVYGHLAPIFGIVMRAIRCAPATALRLFLFQHIRGLVTAAVRLNIVGPMQAQRLQLQMSARAEEVIARCSSLVIDDIAQTAPLLDVWQGAHDRLYSRLFQS